MVGTSHRLVAAFGDRLSRLTADGQSANDTFDRTVQGIATGTSQGVGTAAAPRANRRIVVLAGGEPNTTRAVHRGRASAV